MFIITKVTHLTLELLVTRSLKLTITENNSRLKKKAQLYNRHSAALSVQTLPTFMLYAYTLTISVSKVLVVGKWTLNLSFKVVIRVELKAHAPHLFLAY